MLPTTSNGTGNAFRLFCVFPDEKSSGRDAAGLPIPHTGVNASVMHTPSIRPPSAEIDPKLRKKMLAGKIYAWSLFFENGKGCLHLSGDLLQFLGFSPQDSPLDWEAFMSGMVHPDYHAPLNEVALTAVSTPDYDINIEFQIWSKVENDWRWILAFGSTDDAAPDGVWARISGFTQDIHERVTTRLERERQRSRLDTVVEAAHLGTWDWNLVTGEVHYNKTWADIAGLRLEDIQGSVEAWENALFPEDLQGAMDAVEAHVRGETPMYEAEFRMQRPDGGIIWAVDRGRVVERDKSGEIIRLMGVLQDITAAREATAELARSKNLLELVMRETHFGAWDWNPVRGDIVFSDSFFLILGYENGEVAPTFEAWSTLIHPDDLARSEAALARLIAGEQTRYECEMRMRHRDGHYVWTLDMGHAVEWDDAGRLTRVVGGHFDIQARKRQEEEQEEALTTIALQKMILEQAVEERTVLLRKAKERIDSILATTGQLPGEITSPFDGTSDLAGPGSVLDMAMETGDGEAGPTEDNFAESLGRAFDLITEKMWWYKAIIDSIPFPIFVTDMDGRWTYLNAPALEKVDAADLKDILGAPAGPWGMDEDPADAAQGVDEGGNRPISRYHPGLLRFFQGQASYLYDQQGVRIGHIEAVQDVTEMREKERQLRLARDAAEESTRAKGEFLANMSHEIRTPMNAILGMTRLVLDTALNDVQRDRLEKAEHSARALLRILNDILDFSKIEAGRLEMENAVFNPESVLRTVVDIFKENAREKNLELTLSIDERAPRLLTGDPLRLHQILINLVGNAVKFTDKGKVAVAVSVAERMDDAVRLHFSVKDTGIGLTPGQREKLFSAFSQADGSTTRRYGGTGLGLAISKRLVAMMQGEIACLSEKGVGSEFSFTALFGLAAPGATDEARAPAQGGRTGENPLAPMKHLKGKRILVAEDNEINQIVARELLEKAGFVVELASNGCEAVAMALNNQYDLIFMDIQMPEMDGLTAARELRGHPHLANLPIVAMTAHAMVGDREKSLAVGMNAHITKPIDSDEVFAVLSKWLA